MIVHLQPIAIDVKRYRAFKKKKVFCVPYFLDLGDPDLKVHVVTLIIMGGRHANSEDLRLLGQGNRIQKYLFETPCMCLCPPNLFLFKYGRVHCSCSL